LWTKKILTNENEKVNDVNSPVQTQELEMGEGELQVGASRVDTGGEECGRKFGTRQELKEHTQAH
jgi:hypothetical protein